MRQRDRGREKMARRENETTTTNKEAWGTLEELLLACAVYRHGTNSWDSIAMEVQNRTSHAFTAQNCKQKYRDLKRRFTDGGGDDESETDDGRLVTLVDELKKLRVDELRREVQRRDVSIVSLQLKVKRLEEEREPSLTVRHEEEEEPDPEREPEGVDAGDKAKERSSPVNVAGKSISGEESDDRENRSFNESNSTNPKGENRANEIKREPVEPVCLEPVPVQVESKRVGDWSFNGSLKESQALPVGKTSEEIPVREDGEPTELWESVAESKREGKEGSKQSSDVQSSASLSRKKRRRGRGIPAGLSSSGDEPEGDEVSPATKLIAVKSQPLVRLLEIIRSHKLGSVFERRLRSQDTERFKNLIRQHMDLETVQSRLNKGFYSDCTHKFSRDLLLLFNNAVVFFRKNTPEYAAAQELRKIVTKEIPNNTIRKSKPLMPLKPDPEPHQPDPFRGKPNKSSTTMVVCRKRTSASIKGSLSEATNRKVDKKEREREGGFDEKPIFKLDPKNSEDSFVSMVEEKGTINKKKHTRERSVLGRRSTRTSNKETNGKGGNSEDESVEKRERKESATATAAAAKKKQGAANFLKRIKQNSPSNEAIENVKVLEENGKGEREEEKKRRGRRRDGGRERVTRRSSSGSSGKKGQLVREQSTGQVKRGVGRPPKRQPVMAASTPDSLPAKRAREAVVEAEVVVPAAASGRPRKRPRR